MNAEKQSQERFSRTLSVKDSRQNCMQLKDDSTNSKHIAQLKSYVGFRGQAGLNLLPDNLEGIHPNYRINTGVDVGNASESYRRKNFFKAASLEMSKVGTNVQRIVHASGFTGEAAWEEQAVLGSNKLAEFRCNVRSDNEVEGIPGMSVTIAYSNSQEGYMVGVRDAGRSPGKAKSGIMFEGAGVYHENGNPLVGRYGSQHETGGMALLLEASRSNSFDIHSKLTAEAARFQCVRDHLGELTNSSVFAFKHTKGDYFLVSFENLWKHWDVWFNKGYNLNRAEIIAGLKANRKNYPAEITFVQGKSSKHNGSIKIE